MGPRESIRNKNRRRRTIKRTGSESPAAFLLARATSPGPTGRPPPPTRRALFIITYWVAAAAAAVLSGARTRTGYSPPHKRPPPEGTSVARSRGRRKSAAAVYVFVRPCVSVCVTLLCRFSSFLSVRSALVAADDVRGYDLQRAGKDDFSFKSVPSRRAASGPVPSACGKSRTHSRPPPPPPNFRLAHRHGRLHLAKIV